MSQFKFRIEKGVDAGRIEAIPDTGVSVGRSSQNDVQIKDEMLSRHHCRIYFVNGEPYICDLATVNGTLVNGDAITEDRRLASGDRIRLGGTELLLSAADGSFPVAAPPPAAPVAAPAPAPAAAAPAPVPPAPVDLGFGGSRSAEGGSASAGSPASEKPSFANVKNVAFVCAAIVLLAVIAKVLMGGRSEASLEPAVEERPAPPLSFSYLKTEGSATSVFRYEMTLDERGILTVAIDDLAEDRHVKKSTPSPISADDRDELARKFQRANLFLLDKKIEGLPQDNAWNASRISALVDGRAVTVEVRNRLEPEDFAALREDLETFGRNELGLWAFALSREKLLELAEDSVATANRLFDEREVKPENLFRAFRAYDSAVACLESLEPKPDLYNEAVAGRTEAQSALEKVVEDLSWKADLATKTRDWEAARSALRSLIECVPDRTDERNKSAEKRLLDIESRLK